MITRLSLPFIAGSWLLFVSLVVLVGWWSDNPALVSVMPGHINLVFNAALCFVLCGIALVLPDQMARWQLLLRRSIGCVLLLMAGLTLSQSIFHYSLGIDQLLSRTTVDVFNPSPGRMGNSTAILLCMMGVVLATWSAKPGKIASCFVLTTITVMLVVGLSGLAGYWLNLDFLYHNGLLRMSAYTALNFTVLALGLWAVAHKNMALIPIYNDRYDKKILLTSAMILFVVALIGEFTGFSVFTSQNETILKNNLRQSLELGVKTFTVSLSHALLGVNALTDDAQFRELVVSHSPALASEFTLLFKSRGYSGVEIRDAAGAVVFKTGSVTRPTEAMTSLRLAGSDQTALFWGQGWTLRILKSMTDHGQSIGTLLVELPMLSLDRYYANSFGLGLTGKILVCASGQTDAILCASSRRDGVPLMATVNARTGSPSVRLALSGKQGDGMEVDNDNNEAFTFYRSIPELGLAIVAKRDVSELYESVRVQFEVVLPILLFSIGLGILLLSWQVSPLVRKIVISEKKALKSNARLRESESRFRSAFEFSAVGMALVSLEGRWIRVNYSLGKILGYAEAEFLDMDYQRITHQDDLPVMARTLNELMAGKLQGANMTKRLVTKTHELIWVLINVSLVYDANHKPAYFIFQIQDIDQQKHTEERLTMMAYHDALTGLDNRSAIERDVEAALVTARAYQQMFALLFLDLDHFKEINDHYGHDIGDLFLKEIAQRLRHQVRRSDKVGRLGGDEFVILLEDTMDIDMITEIAKKILRAIAVPVEMNGMMLSVTASLGISCYPNNGSNMEALMKRADIALYCAKELGKNNYHFFVSATAQEE